MSLYNLRTTELGFKVTKFDDDLNVESSYDLTKGTEGAIICTCPAAGRHTCRHRDMFYTMLPKIDSSWFLDFDTRQWVDPTGDASEASSLVELCQTCHGNGTIYPKLASGRIAYTAVPCPECSEATLSQPEPASLPEGVTVIGLDNPGSLHDTIADALGEPRLGDDHPFRRRM